jgi:hypothetical protein
MPVFEFGPSEAYPPERVAPFFREFPAFFAPNGLIPGAFHWVDVPDDSEETESLESEFTPLLSRASAELSYVVSDDMIDWLDFD